MMLLMPMQMVCGKAVPRLSPTLRVIHLQLPVAAGWPSLPRLALHRCCFPLQPPVQLAQAQALLAQAQGAA